MFCQSARFATAMICLFAGQGAAATMASAETGSPAGRLRCEISGTLEPIVKGQKPMECRFTPRRGPVQRYTAIVRHFNLSGEHLKRLTMGWRVYGPYARAPLGALSGAYASAGGTSNHLAGGVEKDVILAPLPLQGLRSFNVAAGVTSLELSLSAGKR